MAAEPRRAGGKCSHYVPRLSGHGQWQSLLPWPGVAVSRQIILLRHNNWIHSPVNSVCDSLKLGFLNSGISIVMDVLFTVPSISTSSLKQVVSPLRLVAAITSFKRILQLFWCIHNSIEVKIEAQKLKTPVIVRDYCVYYPYWLGWVTGSLRVQPHFITNLLEQSSRYTYCFCPS